MKMALMLPATIVLAVKELLISVVDKAPDIIRAIKENVNKRPKEEYDELVQELQAIRKEQGRAAETIDTLVENTEKLNQTIQMLTTLLLALDSTSSGPSRQLQERIRGVLGEGGLLEDVGVPADALEENTSGLTCAVCRDSYNKDDRKPLILPHCGHTFCKKCLNVESRKRVFRCPSCRQDRDQFGNLRPNFALIDVLDLDRFVGHDDEEDLKKGLMDYDSQISLALHMSEEEVKKEEYRMMVDDILQEMEKDMHAQVLTQPDQSDAGTASGAQPRSRSQEGEDFLGKGADGLKEDAHHYEWLEDIEDKDTMESEKEEAEAETYLWYKEQEDLEMAMAMSLSLQNDEEENRT
ncbi:tripartite motif-containing protein 12A-like [Penaeus japonicus]|uniref:tripartite motif-containing protein 12A-like n=1 Tax=Penaeus japonicus TaxID=27405 RepID=UPI001C711CFA|nr:tripartite motif-containing protein 12A-like [Penaeus japonicus]XP_042889631.1 tripartite motif-containing protein 12A-like [Penaeus japonicus]XP_042891639.1 tripartite motif-containing protein 12A-like [Penaeus japonicus]